jgi:xanthine dehydrogenase YagR molybdenum-binding subunit
MSIGDPVDRVDGPLKVTGGALYPSDFSFPDLTHAVLVQSTIAAGTIRGIDAANAEAAPGVLAVITHENAPALVAGPTARFDASPTAPR